MPYTGYWGPKSYPANVEQWDNYTNGYPVSTLEPKDLYEKVRFKIVRRRSKAAFGSLARPVELEVRIEDYPFILYASNDSVGFGFDAALGLIVTQWKTRASYQQLLEWMKAGYYPQKADWGKLRP